MSIQQASQRNVRFWTLVPGVRCLGKLLTEYESEHVWQCSRCIVYNMELACLEQCKPDSSAFAENPSYTSSKGYEGRGIQ